MKQQTTTSQMGNENPDKTFDVVVIGGGINGAGIARDAAGRGLKVMLCEQDDLGRYTSSASSKLIHGGLRYLEHYDFKLVRHSLREREILLRSARHIIWPLRFVLPHHKSLRPRWLLRLGLFIYDHLGPRDVLPGSTGIDLRKHVSGNALKAEFTHGFEYSDCWALDARLVVLNALDAKQRGADILTRSKCIGLERGDETWTVTIKDVKTAEQKQVKTRAVVNASGPWVEDVAGLNKTSESNYGVRLVKGSHVIVKKIFDHDYVYLFQNSDGRILFAIPYENDFTLLGTTDVEITSNPEEAAISEEEIHYLCDNASQYFKVPISADDVVHTYSGVRPLFDDTTNEGSRDASKVTRDYELQLDTNGPAIVSVYGGKLTTFRKLAEQAVDLLAQPLEAKQGPWTENGVLPGGDFPEKTFEDFVTTCEQQYPWCPNDLVSYLARNYGTRIAWILDKKSSMADLGKHFGGLLYEAEVRYLVDQEWAQTADDILWRRTRSGLRADDTMFNRLRAWL